MIPELVGRREIFVWGTGLELPLGGCMLEVKISNTTARGTGQLVPVYLLCGPGMPLRAAASSSVTESVCDHDLPPSYLKRCQTARVQIPVNCVALGKSLHLAKPQPPPLRDGDDNKVPASEVCGED